MGALLGPAGTRECYVEQVVSRIVSGLVAIAVDSDDSSVAANLARAHSRAGRWFDRECSASTKSDVAVLMSLIRWAVAAIEALRNVAFDDAGHTTGEESDLLSQVMDVLPSQVCVVLSALLNHDLPDDMPSFLQQIEEADISSGELKKALLEVTLRGLILVALESDEMWIDVVTSSDPLFPAAA